MTSSDSVAAHNNSMASSPESPINNGGERSAVKVGAKKYVINFIHWQKDLHRGHPYVSLEHFVFCIYSQNRYSKCFNIYAFSSFTTLVSLFNK